MGGQLADRWRLALVGAIGGSLIWAVAEAADADLISARTGLVLLALVGTFLSATLAMAGPIGLARALPRAGGLALVTAGLVWLGGLRHPEGIAGSALSVLAALTIASLPLPFLLISARGGWRDYPDLFIEAWSIVIRFAAASAFTGLVWGVIFLSDQVLRIVGLTVISDLLEHWIVGAVLTGGIFGFGMAVVYEQAELLSPYLVLRLFRLLLPVVLAVMATFLIALPFRGLNGLFDGLSPALLLLTMVGAGIALVSVAVDQTDADATQSPVLHRSAQGMALILPVMAGLAAWAVWQRVAQHGWTPERLFVALVVGLGLAYGASYAVAVLRRAGWMQRIRRANIGIALAGIGLAALWLTPILNADRISARDQLARYDAGRTTVADLDIDALRLWGLAGQAVLAELQERAKAPGQEDLAARLAGVSDPGGSGKAAAIAVLAALMPVQPAGATGTRDSLLAAADEFHLQTWADTCGRKDRAGRPGCLMAVADLLPARPGEEAILVLVHSETFVELVGLYLDDAGRLALRSVLRADGQVPGPEDATRLLEDWTRAPAPLTPALINQLGTGDAGFLFLP